MTSTTRPGDEDRISRASPLLKTTNSIAQLTKGVILNSGDDTFFIEFFMECLWINQGNSLPAVILREKLKINAVLANLS